MLLKQNILFTQRQKYDLPLDKNIQLFAICETTLFSLRIKSTTCLFSIQYSVVCNWCNNFTRKQVFLSLKIKSTTCLLIKVFSCFQLGRQLDETQDQKYDLPPHNCQRPPPNEPDPSPWQYYQHHPIIILLDNVIKVRIIMIMIIVSISIIIIIIKMTSSHCHLTKGQPNLWS